MNVGFVGEKINQEYFDVIKALPRTEKDSDVLRKPIDHLVNSLMLQVAGLHSTVANLRADLEALRIRNSN